MTQQLFSRSPQERTKATSAVDRRLIMALMNLWVTALPPRRGRASFCGQTYLSRLWSGTAPRVNQDSSIRNKEKGQCGHGGRMWCTRGERRKASQQHFLRQTDVPTSQMRREGRVGGEWRRPLCWYSESAWIGLLECVNCSNNTAQLIHAVIPPSPPPHTHPPTHPSLHPVSQPAHT